MKKRKHRVSVYHCIVILSARLLAGISSSCSDDMGKDDGGDTGNEGTGKLTLPVNLTFTPITETKAVTHPVKPGSELAKAGFDYELEVTSCTAPDTLSAPDTKAAPTTLKNVVALLFGGTTGAYKGKAVVSGTATAGSDLLLDFTVNTTTDTSYRLVVVANDNAAKNPYSSTPALSSFMGSYTEFWDIKMTQDVSTDEDVPYVGSITGIKMEGASGTLVVPLYWSLAKITYKINHFSIKDGPAFNRMVIKRLGSRYFGTPGEYNGSGSTATPTSRAAVNTAFAATSNSFYYGENIRPNSSVTSATDRCPENAENAACMYLETVSKATVNTTPAIGKEYIAFGGVTFFYYIYFGDGSVSDFSLRRNTKYTITVNIDGTLEGQRQQAQTDKRIEAISNEMYAGLNIGKFGGATGFSTGQGNIPTVFGYYSKNLLLQPNTSGTMDVDNVEKKWSENTSQKLQTETRRYWDHTYTLAEGKIDKTAGLAYDYCYNLTLGRVPKGTWYLPTLAQLGAIRRIMEGLKRNNSYAAYFATSGYYWSSSEYGNNDNRLVNNVSFTDYSVSARAKSNEIYVRCVRDLD
ncbi:MAG: hypothetical protein LUD46_04850 [Parabacteroides sp.]|nr:hypothetical protein [Parabacteroides sp.]